MNLSARRVGEDFDILRLEISTLKVQIVFLNFNTGVQFRSRVYGSELSFFLKLILAFKFRYFFV